MPRETLIKRFGLVGLVGLLIVDAWSMRSIAWSCPMCAVVTMRSVKRIHYNNFTLDAYDAGLLAKFVAKLKAYGDFRIQH